MKLVSELETAVQLLAWREEVSGHEQVGSGHNERELVTLFEAARETKEGRDVDDLANLEVDFIMELFINLRETEAMVESEASLTLNHPLRMEHCCFAKRAQSTTL